jgi:hypothetical protein
LRSAALALKFGAQTVRSATPTGIDLVRNISDLPFVIFTCLVVSRLCHQNIAGR